MDLSPPDGPNTPNPPIFPPPPTFVPGQPGYQPPRVRFDTIGEAWRLLQQEMSVWVGAVLGYLFSIFAIYFVGVLLLMPMFLVMAPKGSGQDLSAMGFLALLGGWSVLMLAVMAFASVMVAGFYEMAIKQVRGEPIAVGDLFSSMDMALPTFGATLLMGLATMAGAVFCILPAYIVGGLLMLTLPIMADRRVGPIEAMTLSWNMLKQDMWMVTLYNIVLPLIAGLGFLACGVGMVFTMPLLFLGPALVYRDFFILPGAGPLYFTPGSYPPFGPSAEPPPFEI